jgi:hypothetical protein
VAFSQITAASDGEAHETTACAEFQSARVKSFPSAVLSLDNKSVHVQEMLLADP